MPDPAHTSDCPSRQSTAAAAANPLATTIKNIAAEDPDVRIMLDAVLARHKVSKADELPPEVLAEFADVVDTFLEDSPTEERPA